MSLSMTRGWFTELPSGSGRVGIRIQDCTLAARELRLAWVLGSAFSEGMAGAGTTGERTGITITSFSTTIPISPTAEFSSIVTTSIAAADFMEQTDFMAEAREDSP